MSLSDAASLFINVLDNFKKKTISFESPLEEIVLRSCSQQLAYVDNRGSAKNDYGFDLWKSIDTNLLREKGLGKKMLYSESQQFPDFLFKTEKRNGHYLRGSLMELKDSKSASISSFNSTIPTKTKTLEEVDIVNGNNLVSKIASIIDSASSEDIGYMQFPRHCFYFVRTQRRTSRVKLSIIDGAFFETIPKEQLFHQMILYVYHKHIEKKGIDTPKETLEEVEKALQCIDDQTIIACSQVIEKASVRPRLRIMAEVHPEGNPHSAFYPQIREGTFNLILKSTNESKALKDDLESKIADLNVFPILHKRNGEHLVFQYQTKKIRKTN